MKRFAAEVLVLWPRDLPRVVEALAAVDCELEIDHSLIDEHGPTLFGFCTGNTELPEGDIGSWLTSIIWPLGGDVVEWSYGEPWEIRD
jgi:hypothetical protein